MYVFREILSLRRMHTESAVYSASASCTPSLPTRSRSPPRLLRSLTLPSCSRSILLSMMNSLLCHPRTRRCGCRPPEKAPERIPVNAPERRRDSEKAVMNLEVSWRGKHSEHGRNMTETVTEMVRRERGAVKERGREEKEGIILHLTYVSYF
ncbi:hypothetical protein JHK82_034187 [Glycine max]|nr:hypothetical protein JHK86_034254 [Glycine max]KAG5119767.1 hypothetical protein JHK82_034187 [Glycine max]KAG5140758.1 hypothetical protein JHK84_034526 [Glycine max]